MSLATMSTTPIASASTKPDATPKNDHQILIVVVILGIVAAFLIAYIVYITICLKRRQTSGQDLGPYQGTAMTQDHPAANITPFGSVGPHSGGNFPRFSAYLLTVFYSLLVAKLFLFSFLFGFQSTTQEKTCASPFVGPMAHGTSPTPARLSHPWAYQKSTSLHPPYPPDRQPACPPSTHARDFLPTKPKKQEPLAIYPMNLASKSTPRLRRRRHIIASLVNPTLMITLHR